MDASPMAESPATGAALSKDLTRGDAPSRLPPSIPIRDFETPVRDKCGLRES